MNVLENLYRIGERPGAKMPHSRSMEDYLAAYDAFMQKLPVELQGEFAHLEELSNRLSEDENYHCFAVGFACCAPLISGLAALDAGAGDGNL